MHVRVRAPRRPLRSSILGALGGSVMAAAASMAYGPSTAAAEGVVHAIPVEKLACRMNAQEPRRPVVLVSCGSFNPPTFMHLRMCELATDALCQAGYDVWGCYLSPVNDGYGKPGLAPVHHRVQMCELAAQGSDKIMVDSWEASQPGYTRTVKVLQRISAAINQYAGQAAAPQQSSHTSTGAAKQLAAVPPASAAAAARAAGGLAADGSAVQQGTSGPQLKAPVATQQVGQQPVQVMMLCGADLLATIAEPGVWVAPEVVLRDFGVVAISREGQEVEQLLREPGTVLHAYRDKVVVVEEPVPNGISSTKVREALQAGRSVKHLLPDAVVAYIKQKGLYGAGQR